MFCDRIDNLDTLYKIDSIFVKDGLLNTKLYENIKSEEIAELNSPKSVMREAFADNLTDNDTIWIKILEDRNKTSHVYDEDESEEIYNRITDEYTI